ncbi:type II toxin-antitoxin system death-on-curing family toxin [Lentilactobacillus sp. Marseille-Q4993]|uniref:type II toxin-antitoxin system death-on-curing family toxin n=1 Tax=Lentilactobacillus sp. Marseille-Q4993 TaxID=3039492 RepID=UPI0024BCE9E3|nr:type II toxin-antitoxin system death-on-curing family toxin [Lentilactobacillus sp. Marseille-Q4993]
MEYLTEQEIMPINTAIILESGETPFIRNPKGLNSLVTLPKQVVSKKELYPTFHQKVGIVFIKIIKLHIFEDGNKRTAVLAADLMTTMNNMVLTFTNKEIEELALFVAKTEDSSLNHDLVFDKFASHITENKTN